MAETTWPGGADVAVSLTFDVDGEAGWLQAGAEYERRLSTLSDARYGIVRGLPRILSLLDELEVPSTFYIPGDTAVRHARALQAILTAGHEVGHHGHRHLVSYDSSCMGDDRPYIERRGDSSLFEFPVHWHLDDWPYLAWQPGVGGILTPPSQLRDMWLAEFEVAVSERRHVTYTMHPEASGRGLRAVMLRELIQGMRARANVWFAPHRDVHAFVLS